ncbi:MAG: zf-HC2 domain-containing protein [Terracidiphilus sp.]
MNSTPQLGLHPDADSLNAFVEQALGAPEREEILTHIAKCGRCRQVIYLAQQAAADAEAPALASAARPAMPSEAWYRSWRFAWVPAAALAAALALVVTFHPRHTEHAPEMAKAVPQSEEAVPTPALQQQASEAAARKPALALAANSPARKAEFEARRGPSQELSTAAAPSAAIPAEPGTSAASAESSHAVTTLSVESAPQPVAAARFQPEPAVTAWQQERQQLAGALSASANTSQVSQKRMLEQMDAARATRGGSAYSAAPRMAKKSAPAGSFDIGIQQPTAGLAAAHKENPPKLPSGLAALSTATAGHLKLEIDLAGALFLSNDSGQHWEQVARQWTGRAIEVRVQSGNTVPAGEFELKNDGGSLWVSADGKTWTAQ